MLIIVCLVFAGSEDFEPMYFNEDDRLSFETIDNVATGTAYKTLGWVIKKYDLPIDDPNNSTVTCSLIDESYVGEDGKAHTLFYVNRDDVLDKVAQVSLEWASELRTVGGVVYLDSVMTVRQKGDLQGELYQDGSYWGEVYFTYEGISNARYWRNPTDLMQHYDRTVIIDADPDIYNPKPEIIEVQDKVSRFNYGDKYPNVYGNSSIYSDQYDTKVAIPTSENVNIEGEFSKYAYMINYQKITGQRTYGIKVNVKTLLNWIDISGAERNEEVSYSKWYYVDREYCYYKTTNFELYELSKCLFRNIAIGSFSINYDSEIAAIQTSSASITDAQYTNEINIDGGTIFGESNYRPTVVIQDYSSIIDSYVGAIITESDTISIDEEEVLGKEGEKLPSKNETIKVTQNNIKINMTAPNGTSISSNDLVYSNYKSKNKYTCSKRINNIIIHTPVICTSAINNNETQNILNLDESFVVAVKNFGLHSSRKGYGWRDYARYANCNQVKFPFDVMRNNQLIEKGNWIILDGVDLNDSFLLENHVESGEYRIEFRTLALNYDQKRGDIQREYANQSLNDYSAYSYQTVNVIGHIGEKDTKNYRIVGTH